VVAYFGVRRDPIWPWASGRRFRFTVRRTGPSGRQLAMWKSSSWMLSGSRKTSTEYGIGLSASMTPECSMPSSSSQLAHASRLARSATPKEMWSRPVRLSWKGWPGLASWWCRPIAMPERIQQSESHEARSCRSDGGLVCRTTNPRPRAAAEFSAPTSLRLREPRQTKQDTDVALG
jgi:hypothetical protein